MDYLLILYFKALQAVPKLRDYLPDLWPVDAAFHRLHEPQQQHSKVPRARDATLKARWQAMSRRLYGKVISNEPPEGDDASDEEILPLPEGPVAQHPDEEDSDEEARRESESREASVVGETEVEVEVEEEAEGEGDTARARPAASSRETSVAIPLYDPYTGKPLPETARPPSDTHSVASDNEDRMEIANDDGGEADHVHQDPNQAQDHDQDQDHAKEHEEHEEHEELEDDQLQHDQSPPPPAPITQPKASPTRHDAGSRAASRPAPTAKQGDGKGKGRERETMPGPQVEKTQGPKVSSREQAPGPSTGEKRKTERREEGEAPASPPTTKKRRLSRDGEDVRAASSPAPMDVSSVSPPLRKSLPGKEQSGAVRRTNRPPKHRQVEDDTPVMTPKVSVPELTSYTEG